MSPPRSDYVHEEGEVLPALLSRGVGEVVQPELTWPIRLELPVELIKGGRCRAIADGAAHRLVAPRLSTAPDRDNRAGDRPTGQSAAQRKLAQPLGLRDARSSTSSKIIAAGARVLPRQKTRWPTSEARWLGAAH